MDAPTPSKSLPARLVEGAPSARPTPGAASHADEAVLEHGGKLWRVRVLGRSGGRGGRAAPLLLLGFFDSAEADAGPALEAVVVGRGLADLDAGRLETALTGAAAPPTPGRRKPFFEAMGQGRRGGDPQEGTDEG